MPVPNVVTIRRFYCNCGSGFRSEIGYVIDLWFMDLAISMRNLLRLIDLYVKSKPVAKELGHYGGGGGVYVCVGGLALRHFLACREYVAVVPGIGRYALQYC